MTAPSEALEPAAVTVEPDGDPPRNRVSKERVVAALSGDLRALPVAAGLIVLALFFATQSDVFLTSRNLSNLLVQSVTTGTIALGLIFVLLLGEIDLSVAATSGVTAVFMSMIIVDWGGPVPVAIAAGVLLGALIGFTVGAWTTRFLVPSFVVTLGAGLLLNGVQLMLLPRTGRYNLLNTGIERIAGSSVGGVWAWLVLAVALSGAATLRWTNYRHKGSHGLARSWRGDVLVPMLLLAAVGIAVVAVLNGHNGIPLPVLIFLVFLAVAGYFVTETQMGVHLYAVGGNQEAARRAGIPVERVKIRSFTIAGALAAFAGIMAASRILGVSVSSGGGIGGGALLLESIAAAVIGGVSLFGGRGRVSAALLGALVIGTVSNGLNLMGVESEVKLVVTGLLLILAVTVDRSIERFAEPGRV